MRWKQRKFRMERRRGRSTKELKTNGQVRQQPDSSIKKKRQRMIHAAPPPLLRWDLLSLPLLFDLQRRVSTRLLQRCLAHLPSDASNVKFRSKRLNQVELVRCIVSCSLVKTEQWSFVQSSTLHSSHQEEVQDNLREKLFIWGINYLLKLFLGLLFHPPDVLHGQTHPSVNPAEQLAVEVGENTLFLLW